MWGNFELDPAFGKSNNWPDGTIGKLGRIAVVYFLKEI